MKLKGHVIMADDTGETIIVTLQTVQPGAPDWRPWLRQEIRLPSTAVNRRAFYLGRNVEIVVTPK